MTHEQVKAVLAGEAPDNPEVAMHLATCADCRAVADGLAAVDALARTLPAIPVPQDLIERTTVAMDREIHPRVRRRPAVWAGGAFALAAALLLFFRGPSSEVGDPDKMIERGPPGITLPDLDLRVAVLRGGSVERYSRDRAYAPGDQLQFRATASPASSSIAIFHVAPSAQVERVDRGGGDAAWEIEPTDEGAIFVGVASPAPLSADQIVAVEGALGRAYNGDAARLCDAVTEQGLGCAATPIHLDGDREAQP